jgi:PAS domain S-box-containing protein
MNLLLDIVASLYEAKNFYEIGEKILSIMKNLSDAHTIGGKIGIYNKEIDEYRIYYNSQTQIDKESLKDVYNEVFRPCKYNEIKFFSRIVADTGEMMLIQDSHCEEACKVHPGHKDFPAHAMMWLPLIYKNEFLGIISLGSEPVNSFTDEIIETVKSIAKVVSIKVFELLTSEKLLKSEERYRQLVETADDAIVLTNLEGRHIYHNPAYLKSLGYENDNEIGTNGFANVHPDDIMIIKEKMAAIFSKGVLTGEYRIRHRNGLWRYRQIKTVLLRNTDGKPESLLSIIRDITEQKQVEDSLKFSEQKFRNFINQASDGFLFVNENGYIIECNPALENIFNLKREDIINQLSWEVVKKVMEGSEHFEDYFGDFRIKLEEIFRTGKSDYLNIPKEGKIKSKNNEEKFIQNTIFPIKTDSGYLLGSVIRDITSSKISDKKIHENEERLRILAEQTGQIVYDWNMKTGQINWIGLIEKITGFTFDEFQTVDIKEWELLVHPEDRKRVVELLDTVKVKGEKYNVDYRWQKRDTSYFYVEDNGIFLKDENNNPIRMLGTIKDISERKAAEESLFASARKWQTTFDAVSDVIWILDKDGRITRSNHSVLGILGIDPESIQGKLCCEVLHAAIPDYNCSFKKLKKSLHREFSELYINNKWLEINDHPIFSQDGEFTGAVQIISDISDRKRAELERDRFFYNSIDMLSISGFDGNFKQINPAWTKILGWSESDLLAKPILDLVHPDDYDYSVNSIKSLINGKPMIKVENRYRCKDGSYRWFEWNSYPFSEDGLIFSVIRDITSNKESEAEQLRLQNLESLGILAGGIAHDFNNILTTIMGQASIAMQRLKDEKSKSSLLSILEATKRAVGLTHQLLTFAKGGTPQKSILEIDKLIEDTTKFALSGSNINPKFNFMDSFGLEADSGQISQVIQNIVINAKQAMPNGGEILISTGNFIDNEGNLFIMITIKDFGIGIPKEYLDKIFNPYFTTKQTGSGLGLSVCHSIINRHDGNISVESESGIGTTFKILLPAIEKSEIEKSLVQNTVIEHLNILIMDDDITIREILKEILIELGHSVDESSEGNETIKLYNKSLENNRSYDLVFLDLTIRNGLGGRETVKILKEINPSAKIIVSSGYADSSVSKYKEDGFSAKLNKPYTIDEVNEVIFQLLENK